MLENQRVHYRGGGGGTCGGGCTRTGGTRTDGLKTMSCHFNDMSRRMTTPATLYRCWRQAAGALLMR
jgi:hypothetical protein